MEGSRQVSIGVFSRTSVAHWPVRKAIFTQPFTQCCHALELCLNTWPFWPEYAARYAQLVRTRHACRQQVRTSGSHPFRRSRPVVTTLVTAKITNTSCCRSLVSTEVSTVLLCFSMAKLRFSK